jgi:DNA-directed RNA polymerase subunit RPC12/RpoP
MAEMVTQWCKECGRETPQNPLKLTGTQKVPDYRCTQCGYPWRGGHKHDRLVGGKYKHIAKP